MIAQMARIVDIPIELGGGLRTFDDVQCAFDKVGVYRVVLGTMFVQNPDEAKRAIDVYGPNKVIVAIDEYNRHVKVNGWTTDSGLLAISAALNAKALGFRRIVYSDITAHGLLRSPNLDFIRQLAETTHMRITASGGIAGLDDLLRMQELEPLGVDSVLIGRALYANKFACQGIWRLCEAGDFPYTAKV
jgi:phosphoribosylformimino-5-aminoimidazole carboxamide ribotide isomerase